MSLTQPTCDTRIPGACGYARQSVGHKACHTKLGLHNEGVSRELGPAVRAFPVCRDEAARGTYASEAPPQAADPSLNALLNRTAEVLC